MKLSQAKRIVYELEECLVIIRGKEKRLNPQWDKLDIDAMERHRKKLLKRIENTHKRESDNLNWGEHGNSDPYVPVELR